MKITGTTEHLHRPFLRYAHIAAASAMILLAVAFTGCNNGEDTVAPAVGKNPSSMPDQAEVSAAKIGGDPENGKLIYEKYCHFCHGRTGLGDGPVGIAISPHPANFVDDRKRMEKTDSELFKSITYGIQKEIGGDEMAMPRWKEILSEKERRDVLAYVRHLEREGLMAKEAAVGKDKKQKEEGR